MKKLNLGIIGLGYIGETHLNNGLKLTNINVASVADLSKRALKKAKEKGVKNCYENYSDLLKRNDIDAVVISLPNFLHHKCAMEAFEQGKNVFLEKPMAISVREAKEIVSAAEKRSLKLMMGYPMRFQEEYADLKEKMHSGVLGDIEIAQASYIGGGPFFHRADGQIPAPVPDWWFNRDLTGGGVMMDLGCHMINLLRWFFGEITDLRSFLGYRFNFDFEDSASCIIKFNSGTRATLNLGWYSQSYKVSCEFFGSVGFEKIEVGAQSKIRTAYGLLTKNMKNVETPHYKELDYFATCLLTDVYPSLSSGEDGLKDMQAISLAYKNNTNMIED